MYLTRLGRVPEWTEVDVFIANACCEGFFLQAFPFLCAYSSIIVGLQRAVAHMANSAEPIPW